MKLDHDEKAGAKAGAKADEKEEDDSTDDLATRRLLRNTVPMIASYPRFPHHDGRVWCAPIRRRSGSQPRSHRRREWPPPGYSAAGKHSHGSFVFSPTNSGFRLTVRVYGHFA